MKEIFNKFTAKNTIKTTKSLNKWFNLTGGNLENKDFI